MSYRILRMNSVNFRQKCQHLLIKMFLDCLNLKVHTSVLCPEGNENLFGHAAFKKLHKSHFIYL